MDFSKIDPMIVDKPEEAYAVLKKMYESDGSLKGNIEFMWRLAKACMLWANKMQKKNPLKKQLIFEGRSYATTAYALDEKNFEALRWTAVLTGAATDYLGPKEKVTQGKAFKQYLDKAITINPKEFTLLYLRGRFNFEVANLSWLERKVCNALFSGVPIGSIEESLADFLEAERYAPFVWPENLLYIARCYALKSQKESAEKYLSIAAKSDKIDDAIIEAMNETRALIAKCK